MAGPYYSSRNGVEGAASFTSRFAFRGAIAALAIGAAVEVLDRPILGTEVDLVENISQGADDFLNDIGGNAAIVREF